MSKLEELLQGVNVEWMSVDEIFTVKNGYTPSKSKEEYWKDGTIPWFRMEDIRKNGRVLNSALQNVSRLALKGNLIPANSLIMSTTATLGEHALVKTPFLTNQQITSFSLRDSYIDKISAKYLFYCFFDFGEWSKENANQNGGLGIIGLSKLKKYKFPIPCPDNQEKSLEIQQEIVRLLDELTSLTNQLKTELETERQSRKKQFEFFREQLFSFKEEKAELKNLLDVSIKISSGGTPNTKKIEYWENGTIPWMSSGEVNFGTIYKTEKYITEEGLKNSSAKFIPKNSIVIALAGQGKTRGMVARTKIELTTNQSLGTLNLDNNIVNTDYVYYYLKTQYENLRTISSGNENRGGLNLKMISSYPIPIPSLAEQERIVKLLDQFDATHTAIEEEITKEIKLRTQQYEYYREKLLTFPEN